MKFRPIRLDMDKPVINERFIKGYGSIQKAGVIKACNNKDFLVVHLNGMKYPFFIATNKLKRVLKDKPKKRGMWKGLLNEYAFIFRRGYDSRGVEIEGKTKNTK